ncbi:MAG: tetratricopeptide repeat protein [Planctomycetes bacterium]|nr:tetratricopeptide repeat protein [Planctomycetota bacterium]
MSRRSFACIPILFASAVFSGCAPTGVFLATRPADIDIGGWERLLVLEFDAEPQPQAPVHSAVVQALFENGHYSLTDPADFAAVRRDAPQRDLLSAARMLEVDAVLIGSVAEWRVADRSSTEAAPSSWGGWLGGNPTRRDRDESIVGITYELLDVQSGEIRDRRTSVHRYRHHNRHEPAPPSDKTMDDLTRSCASDIVRAITPHRIPVQVRLARQFYGQGLAELRAGNDAARSGDWAAAEASWERAVQRSPRNHAAHFNLALAAEARADYASASRHLDQAIELFGDSLYQQYRRQLVQDRAQHTAAIAQSQSRNVLAVARRQLREATQNVGFDAPYPPP